MTRKTLILSKLALIHFLFVLIILCSCNNEPKRPAHTPVCNILTGKDYQLISAALEQFVIHEGKPDWKIRDKYYSDLTESSDSINMILVNDSTDNELVDFNNSKTQIRKKHLDEDMDLKDKLELLNDRRYAIDGSIITGIKNHVLTNEESYKLNHMNYPYIYLHYPNAYGVFFVSKPAFNDDDNEALIYIGTFRSPKLGYGSRVWMKKEGERWIISFIEQTWIS